VKIVGILGTSHPSEKTTQQGEENFKDSAGRNVHKICTGSIFRQ